MLNLRWYCVPIPYNGPFGVPTSFIVNSPEKDLLSKGTWLWFMRCIISLGKRRWFAVSPGRSSWSLALLLSSYAYSISFCIVYSRKFYKIIIIYYDISVGFFKLINLLEPIHSVCHVILFCKRSSSKVICNYFSFITYLIKKIFE